MIKSLNTGVSGIKSQQTKLDVIANNMVNVSTAGFKKDTVEFSTVLNQTVRGATNGTEAKGGINPSSIGLGVKVAGINTNHEQGSLTSTGRVLDAAIQGDGYFTVTDGVKTYYTRNGGFNLSPVDGSLVLSNGLKVIGFPLDPQTGEVDKSNGASPIMLPTSSDVKTQATTEVSFGSNIQSSLANGESVTVPFYVYDSLGTKHELSIELTKTGAGSAEFEINSPGGLVLGGNTGTITFDTDGKTDVVTGGPLTFNPIGAEPMSVELNFDKVTMLDKKSDFCLRNQDGMEAGSVSGISIGDGGLVNITYTNGMSETIAVLAITTFENPSGLINSQDTMFEESANTGTATLITGLESANTSVAAGYLEASNVDVSSELTDMITTQRAFSVSSKIITISDEILQELIGMKR